MKTDRRDARALCEACRLGAYRAAHRTSDAARHRRAEVAVREALVNTRTKFISVIRSFVRREGLRVPGGGAANFAERLQRLELPAELQVEVAPLLAVMESVNERIKAADKRLRAYVKTDDAARRLCTVPGAHQDTAGPATSARAARSGARPIR